MATRQRRRSLWHSMKAVRSGKIAKKATNVMLEGVGGGFTWGAVLLDL